MSARAVVFLLIVVVSYTAASPLVEKASAKRGVRSKPNLHELLDRLERAKKEKVEEEASELDEREFPERPREVEQEPKYWKKRFSDMKREEFYPELPRYFEARRSEELLPAPRSEFEKNHLRLKKEELEENPDQYWKGRFRFLDEGEKQGN